MKAVLLDTNIVLDVLLDRHFESEEFIMSATETLPAPDLRFAAPDDDKWQRERRAFVQMLPELVDTHRVRNGVGSRFRATMNHMESGLPENDSRPLPRNVTRIHLSVPSVALQAYRQHGPIPIYVGLVSDQPPLPMRIPSPIRRH